MNKIAKCVIDCETTGLDPALHDIIEIAIVPVDGKFEQIGSVFNQRIKALTPETASACALAINQLNPCEGAEHKESLNLFYDWMNLNCIERIAPIGFNYAFDKGFILKWLGTDQYNQSFHYIIRDAHTLAIAYNDSRIIRGQKPMTTSTSLGKLCDHFGLDHSKAHSAIQDCYLTLKIYKNLLMLA